VFLALGSEGRREQTLATDQDNAIVYHSNDQTDDEICRDYFLKLGSIICNSLNKAGYPLCKGGVMAMNKEWCKSFDEWKITITDWINTPNPQEVLNTSIFFDFRPIYGDFELANSLQKFCLKSLKDKNIYFFNLAKSIINLKPTSIDSHTTNQEGYDVKLPILAITSIARLWSLRYGISERNTSERLFALQSIGVITGKLREEFDQAFRYFMLLRIKNQIHQIESNEEPSKLISPKNLSDIDRIMIKRGISTISDHMNRLAMEFRIS